VLFVALLLGLPARADGTELSVPKLPIYPTPIVRKAIPLSYALAEVAGHVQGGYVLFGAEIREVGSKEPTVDLNVTEAQTLSDALRDVFRQMPGYTVEVVSQHMINIYPQGAKDDPKDPLNLRVEHFDVVNEQPEAILNYPDAYIFTLAKRLVERTVGPPYPIAPPSLMTYGIGPTVTLHLQNVTVRQILNAVSKATESVPPKYSPLSWVALFRPDHA
jgi:hypothetical protein